MKQSTVQIDKAGRVVLPKPLRERFGLRGGDTLEIEVKGDAVELRPVQAIGKLKRVNGVLVYSPPGSLADKDYVDQAREERIDHLIGRLKSEK